jgi:hypothetical protein
MVGGGVAGRIGFDFNDSTTYATVGNLTHHDFSDQKSSQGDSADGELNSAKAAKIDRRSIQGTVCLSLVEGVCLASSNPVPDRLTPSESRKCRPLLKKYMQTYIERPLRD